MANSNDLYNAELGQYGSGLLDAGEGIDLSGASATHQIIAISILEASTTFTDLESPQGTKKYMNDEGAAWDTDFGAAAAGNALASTDLLPAGYTMYGRWDKVTVLAGSVMFYVAPNAAV